MPDKYALVEALKEKKEPTHGQARRRLYQNQHAYDLHPGVRAQRYVPPPNQSMMPPAIEMREAETQVHPLTPRYYHQAETRGKLSPRIAAGITAKTR